MDFWSRIEEEVLSGEMVIDRPRGSRHPKYPAVCYPVDYGYIKGVMAQDGNEIDVWRGTLPDARIVGIACSADALKHDVELKLLIGCTAEEITVIQAFYDNNPYISAIVVERGGANANPD